MSSRISTLDRFSLVVAALLTTAFPPLPPAAARDARDATESPSSPCAGGPLWHGKTVWYWGEQLLEEDEHIVRLATSIVRDMGARAAPALPSLVQHVRRRPRSILILTLGEIGPAAASASPFLAQLASRDDHARRWALEVLEKMGNPPLRPLPETLHGENETRHAGAALAAGQVGARDRNAAQVLAGLARREGDLAGRYLAIERLAGASPDPGFAVETLIAVMGDADVPARESGVRKAAARALGEMGWAAKDALPALRRVAAQDDLGHHSSLAGQARASAVMVSGLGIEALIETLQDPDEAVRRGATRALAKFGAEARPAIDALVQALVVEDPRWRSDAALTLLAIGAADPAGLVELMITKLGSRAAKHLARLGESVAPALIEMYSTATLEVRSIVVAALVRMDPISSAALPIVIEAMSSDEKGWTVRALQGAAPHAPESIPALARALHHESWVARLAAVDALARYGARAGAAEEDLIQLITSDADRDVRLWATSALGDVAPDSEASARVLLGLLPRGDGMRVAAAAGLVGSTRVVIDEVTRGLGQVLRGPPGQVGIGGRNKSGGLFVVNAAWGAIANHSGSAPFAAAHSLARIGSPAVPELVTALSSRTNAVAFWAAWALGYIGAHASDAIPPLEAALRDPDPCLRGRAARSLGEIGVVQPSTVRALARLLDDESDYVRRNTAWASSVLARGATTR